ncbi:hypothetical protein GS634_07955 [Ruegeria atlantica]|uniref:Uncharacterized protein n=1 Tax=Ruegeria atlantica TaxID=81569 RepID=A0AA91BQY9_9RHOB|nr:hypothetical protein [Ruegeria atlantica]NOE18057.1 hypothetical protein [Ruegeria atlantica]
MSAHCQSIRDEIETLEQSIELLDIQIQNTVDPIQKSALFRFRKQSLSLLQRKRGALKACEESGPPLPQVPADMSDFGSEVTQGIPGYELVAGKDTLARIFVGRRPPVVVMASELLDDADSDYSSKALGFDLNSLPIHSLPFNPARIDYAELEISGPSGTTVIPGDIGDGVFSNDTKSFSEDDNINFYIRGREISKPGRHRFTARLYRNGTLVGEKSVGQPQFHPTKDLRILVVVEIFPFPAVKWEILFQALEDLSRIFPIRSGLAPLDGDQEAGLRYRIEPIPIDFAWPDRTPVAQRLAAFNQEQSAAGRPDRAEHVLTIRTQQPGEMPLGGSAQSGPNGSIAGVTLNVDPPMDNSFGTLVSHEIAHNFLTVPHVGDEGVALNEPAAFDLVARKSVGNPRALMYRIYNLTPNGTAFLVPDSWRTIRERLLTRSSTGNDE